MKKRIASLALALVLCLGLTVPASAAFTDVSDGQYFAAPVAWAVEQGITTGTTASTFSPHTTCTRAQIITFLWRAAGQPEPKSAVSPFSDVTDTSAYYYKAALWAREQGMVSGSTFAPSDPCTRAMAVEFMWKQAGSPSAAKAAFTDVSSSASYAEAVNWAVEAGVTNGTTATTFSPDTTCTRAQIATFLYRGFAEETEETEEEASFEAKVFSVTGYTNYLDGENYTTAEMSGECRITSAYEADFTLKFPHDFNAVDYFAIRLMTGDGAYYEIDTFYPHLYSLYDIAQNWSRIENAVFSDSNVSYGAISFHLTLPEDGPFTFEQVVGLEIGGKGAMGG